MSPENGGGRGGGGGSVDRVGLCRTCTHHRLTGNRRGSVFYMCERSLEDPSFPKYPPLPVLECRGYEAGGEDPWEKEFGRRDEQ